MEIKYFDYISSLKNNDCTEALARMVPKINMQEIYEFIDSVPFISGLQKEFYKTIITARKERILDFSFTKYKKINFIKNGEMAAKIETLSAVKYDISEALRASGLTSNEQLQILDSMKKEGQSVLSQGKITAVAKKR